MIRKCLRCNEDFNSEGAHNRLCNRCNFLNSREGIYKANKVARFSDKQLESKQARIRRSQNRGDE